MSSNKSQDYFPKDYVASRQRFRDEMKQIVKPVEIGFWKVPSSTDDDLCVDYAWLPSFATPKDLLILISGIHGAETYAGSAVLQLFLKEILPEINRSHLGILIVHAMNPYGFKNHCRSTENKVNLNRNFSVSGELFKSKNSQAERLNNMFVSRRPVTSIQSDLIQSMKIKDGGVYFSDVSVDELIKGISPGQFDREDDHEYGGKKLEPQSEALIQKIKEIIPPYENIVVLDIHTGLGHRGRLHLLTDGEDQSAQGPLFSRIFKPEEDKKYYEFTPATAEGFYQVHGATNSILKDLKRADQSVCSVTLEFGTLGHSPEQQISDLNLSALAHQGEHYGFADSELEKKIKVLNFEKSYPDDDQWRSDVLAAAKGLIQTVIKRLSL